MKSQDPHWPDATLIRQTSRSMNEIGRGGFLGPYIDTTGKVVGMICRIPGEQLQKGYCHYAGYVNFLQFNKLASLANMTPPDYHGDPAFKTRLTRFTVSPFSEKAAGNFSDDGELSHTANGVQIVYTGIGARNVSAAYKLRFPELQMKMAIKCLDDILSNTDLAKMALKLKLREQTVRDALA